MSGHHLVNGGLTADGSGVTARCTCNWVSGGHFSSAAASAAFLDHQEGMAIREGDMPVDSPKDAN